MKTTPALVLAALSASLVGVRAFGAVGSGFTQAPGEPQLYRLQSGSNLTLPGNTPGAGVVGPTHLAQMPVVSGSSLSRASSVPSNLSPAAGPHPNLGSFNIVINPNATLAGNAPALAAFQRAANEWTQFISDPITVTVDAGLAVLPAGVIGSTSSVILQAGYNTIRNRVAVDADPDDGILASMPTAAQFVGTVPSGRTFNGNLIATKADLKALQFTGLDNPPASGGFGPSDGTITFSNTFAFDFDRGDGATPGTLDFESVAAHEIGHLLGFFSSVDDVDAGVTQIQPSTLDLLRFANIVGTKPTSAAQFTTAPRNFVPGADDITSDTASEYRMSTGLTGGDGNQASHWKADELTGNYVGIMDPTLAFGQVDLITPADMRAMDLIGYDILVPEPGMLALLPVAGIVMRRRGRRISVP